MVMKRLIPVLLLIFIMVGSGCLFKPPAEVKFSVDKTVVGPGGTIHLMVVINNTGKVGLTGATLVLGSDEFAIIQEPKFPQVLKVGESVQLMWILQAPNRPGYYNLKVSLELTDELKRSWTGFYGQFRIIVSDTPVSSKGLTVNVTAPRTMEGGKLYPITVEIHNGLDSTVSLIELKLDLLDGMEIQHYDQLPKLIKPNERKIVVYMVKAPYRKTQGYVSAILKYRLGKSEKELIQSVPVKVIWKPWKASEGEVRDAYGFEYYWVVKPLIVDQYWGERYNSTSQFDRSFFKNFTTEIIEGAESETEAATMVFNWILRRYSLAGTTTTVNPSEILEKDSISYTEAQILTTAMMRSLNVPSILITVFDGNDCTKRPITGFYTTMGWYIIDIRHGFVGPIEDYLASPYFPRIYQLVTKNDYKLVAQNPTLMVGHEHMDVTDYFISDLENRLLDTLTQRTDPELRSKLVLIVGDLRGEERLYALFLLSSAPTEDDLNKLLRESPINELEENIKTMYEFYKNMEWADDFTKYWRIFAGEV